MSSKAPQEHGRLAQASLGILSWDEIFPPSSIPLMKSTLVLPLETLSLSISSCTPHPWLHPPVALCPRPQPPGLSQPRPGHCHPSIPHSPFPCWAPLRRPPVRSSLCQQELHNGAGLRLSAEEGELGWGRKRQETAITGSTMGPQSRGCTGWGGPLLIRATAWEVCGGGGAVGQAGPGKFSPGGS